MSTTFCHHPRVGSLDRWSRDPEDRLGLCSGFAREGTRTWPGVGLLVRCRLLYCGGHAAQTGVEKRIGGGGEQAKGLCGRCRCW